MVCVSSGWRHYVDGSFLIIIFVGEADLYTLMMYVSLCQFTLFKSALNSIWLVGEYELGMYLFQARMNSF